VKFKRRKDIFALNDNISY